MPKVSVIMSVRNGERYLKQSIQSILRQSFSNFEFIIVDDSSTDSTPKILKMIKDPRLKIITNKRKKGLTRSLNVALRKSQGKFIARMDSDDVANKNRLDRQVKFLEKNKDVGVVGSWVELIDQYGKKQGILKFPLSYQEITRKIFLFNPIRHSTVMFRKELIEKYGLYDENLDGAEDYDLWFRLTKYTRLVNIGQPLLSYRVHKDRVSEKEEKKVLLSAIKAKIRAIFKYGYSPLNLIFLIFSLITYLIPKKLKDCFR